MKNFYELPDTNLISITIKLIPDPSARVTVVVNGTSLLVNTMLTALTTLTTEINVRSSLSICIATDAIGGHVNIESVHADKVMIIPKYIHLSTTSHISNTPTTLIRFNEHWELNTTIPLLWWIHEHTGNGWLLYP